MSAAAVPLAELDDLVETAGMVGGRVRVELVVLGQRVTFSLEDLRREHARRRGWP